MPEKIITATLHNLSPVPNGAIYQGSGMFEFVVTTDKPASTPGKIEIVPDVNNILMPEPYDIEKKFAEYDPDLRLYYKDPAVKTELVSDVLVAEAEKTEIIERADKELDAYIVEKESVAVDVPIDIKPVKK